MKKQNFKYQRRNEDIRREMSVLIRDEIKDYRVSPLTNVTGVDLTPDLQFCKVYISVLGDDKQMNRTIEGLRAAAGFLRRELARRLNLRHTPELQFVADHSVEYGARMDALINQVSKADAERPVGQPINADNVYAMDEEEDEL